MKHSLSRFKFRIFALAAILLAGISSAFAQKQTIAIVNAGSSGSRLYMYAVDTRTHSVDTVYTRRFAARLSDMVPDQPEAVDFCKALSDIGTSDSKIDLYILATAGMRTVANTTAVRIYAFLKTSPDLQSKYNIKKAMTISGQQEGLYAWIAANYDNRTLPGKDEVRPEQSRGILEIGGASMQIAFVSEKSSVQNSFPHKIYGNIYSKSYIDGGVNAVYRAKTTAGDNDVHDYSRYILNLPTINDCFGGTLVFFGLGGTVNGVNKRSGANFIGYLENYNEDPTKENPDTHYVSNTYYLKWVLKKLGLTDNSKIEARDSDWTKGAAYDLVINNVAPQEFNYDMTNPN